MGMYTGFKGTIILKENIPVSDRETIEFMVSASDDEWPHEGLHPMFSKWRCKWMLRGSSAYLDDEFQEEPTFDGVVLRVCFNIKNYEREIQVFLDWIEPLVESARDCWYQYEEDDEKTRVEFIDNKWKGSIPWELNPR